MNTTSKTLALILSLPLAISSAHAQSRPGTAGPCHGAVEEIDVRLIEEGRIDCDAGLTSIANVPGVTRAHCPKFVIVYPAYAQPRHRDEETGFVALFARQVPVTMHFMRCDTEWFLFFPLSDDCVVDRSVTAGHRDHYQLESCDLAIGGAQ